MPEERKVAAGRQAYKILTSRIDNSYFGEKIDNSVFALFANFRPGSGELGELLSDAGLMQKVTAESDAEEKYGVTNARVAFGKIMHYLESRPPSGQEMDWLLTLTRLPLNSGSPSGAIIAIRGVMIETAAKIQTGNQPWTEVEKVFRQFEKLATVANEAAEKSAIDVFEELPDRDEVIQKLLQGTALADIEMPESFRERLAAAIDSAIGRFKREDLSFEEAMSAAADDLPEPVFAMMPGIYREAFIYAEQNLKTVGQKDKTLNDYILLERVAKSFATSIKEVLTEVGRPPRMDSRSQGGN